MTIAASHPRWTIRPLRVGDRKTAVSFLDREHELNVYLLARLHEAGLEHYGHMLAVFRDSRLVAIASAMANVAIAIDPDLHREEVDHVSGLIAERLIQRCSYLRAIISPAGIVEALWEHLREHFEDPTVVRLRQPVYRLSSLESSTGLRNVRYGRLDDLDLLVPACAAMHAEEIGINPLHRDAFGYHQRIRDLIEQKRSFVWMMGNQIAFKCEVSAETSKAVQLMGVWTAPSLRRRGYAFRGLSEVCGQILRTGRTITLFVNDFNTPARALYERLGFRLIGENRALIW